MKRASALRVLRQPEPGQAAHPRYVVWELTLACDQRCTHCGSRAAEARAGELSTAEALGVVAELAALGTRELAVIGGEAYLHPGFLDIVAAAQRAGIRVTMTTGGRSVTAELARQCAAAGMHGISVSVDGLPPRTTSCAPRAAASTRPSPRSATRAPPGSSSPATPS